MSRTSSPRRAIATSGTIRSAASKPAQCGAAPPSSAKAKPPTATRPAPAGPSGASASADPASSRHAAAVCSNRRGPRPSSRRTQPSAASAAPSAVGLLEAEPRLAGAARGEGDGARVDGRRQRQRDADQHLAAAAARAPDGALAALAQPGLVRQQPAGDERRAHAVQARAAPRTARRPVRQRSSTRPDGVRCTEVTDSVPLTPLVVKRPSTRTR